MKLLYLNYIKGAHKHPLDGFDQRFRIIKGGKYESAPLCLAGINGSGKSKFMEIV